jgi:hypothetical protein
LQAGEERGQIGTPEAPPAPWRANAWHVASIGPTAQGGEVHAEECRGLAQIEPERFDSRVRRCHGNHTFLYISIYNLAILIEARVYHAPTHLSNAHGAENVEKGG